MYVLSRVPRAAFEKLPVRATEEASSPAEEGTVIIARMYIYIHTYIHTYIPCIHVCRFSTYFAAPSWQKKAVSTYLTQVNRL